MQLLDQKTKHLFFHIIVWGNQKQHVCSYKGFCWDCCCFSSVNFEIVFFVFLVSDILHYVRRYNIRHTVLTRTHSSIYTNWYLAIKPPCSSLLVWPDLTLPCCFPKHPTNVCDTLHVCVFVCVTDPLGDCWLNIYLGTLLLFISAYIILLKDQQQTVCQIPNRNI